MFLATRSLLPPKHRKSNGLQMGEGFEGPQLEDQEP